MDILLISPGCYTTGLQGWRTYRDRLLISQGCYTTGLQGWSNYRDRQVISPGCYTTGLQGWRTYNRDRLVISPGCYTTGLQGWRTYNRDRLLISPGCYTTGLQGWRTYRDRLLISSGCYTTRLQGWSTMGWTHCSRSRKSGLAIGHITSVKHLIWESTIWICAGKTSKTMLLAEINRLSTPRFFFFNSFFNYFFYIAFMNPMHMIEWGLNNIISNKNCIYCRYPHFESYKILDLWPTLPGTVYDYCRPDGGCHKHGVHSCTTPRQHQGGGTMANLTQNILYHCFTILMYRIPDISKPGKCTLQIPTFHLSSETCQQNLAKSDINFPH